MATKTRAQMIDWLLEHIGIKAAGQSANSSDTDLGGRVFDSVYDQLRKMRLAPYATSAVPEWAQMPTIKYMGWDAGSAFNLSAEKRQGLRVDHDDGRRELAEQVAGFRHSIPIKGTYF